MTGESFVDRDGIPGSADVVVVGSGIAGSCAFLEANAAGLDVIGIEQDDVLGGASRISGGGCCIAGTPLQQSLGIHDSAELGMRDLVTAGAGEAHELWARLYFESAVELVYEWFGALGVEFTGVRAQEDNSVPRWHTPAGGGLAIMAAVMREMDRRSLSNRWYKSTSLVDLEVVSNGITGVVVRDKIGSVHQIQTRVAIIATGGFAGNYEMVLEAQPSFRRVERLLVGGGRGALGSGHRALKQHGATFRNLENVWTYPSATPDYRDEGSKRGLLIRGIGSGIWVNRDSRRFLDESQTGAGAGTPLLLRQPGATCWAIVDASGIGHIRISDPYRPSADRPDPSERFDELVTNSPYVHKADSIRQLATKIGLPARRLAACVRSWNALVASGAESDPLTRRRLVGVALLVHPPFYAVQMFPLARKNLGGVETNLDGAVLGRDGVVITGLFAAGELAGFGGGHLAGRKALEGIMFAGSAVSGRIAGVSAARAAVSSAAPQGWRRRGPRPQAM